MNYFISCDWGTSIFRLRLIDADTSCVLAETLSTQGIAATYTLWQEQQNENRFLFYRNYLSIQIEKLEEISGSSLQTIPLIISGMASSAIGMKELPYKQIPFKIQAQDLSVDIEEATVSFPHKIILVSGVRSANDVMRGEETILAGCAVNSDIKKQLFILPGTHSKHITVEDGILVDIKTYMTGEVFELLSSKSILSASVEKHNAAIENNNSFMKGVEDASVSSLLNNIFHVRTNTLFKVLNKQDNYAYLSGLLIGEELKYLSNKNAAPVTIVSSKNLLKLYYAALSALNKNYNLSTIHADEALIKAQAILFNYCR